MLDEPKSNVKLAIYEYYSHPACAGPINVTRDTNIVGVVPTAQEKLQINVSQGSGCAKMAVKNDRGCSAFGASVYEMGARVQGCLSAK